MEDNSVNTRPEQRVIDHKQGHTIEAPQAMSDSAVLLPNRNRPGPTQWNYIVYCDNKATISMANDSLQYELNKLVEVEPHLSNITWTKKRLMRNSLKPGTKRIVLMSNRGRNVTRRAYLSIPSASSIQMIPKSSPPLNFKVQKKFNSLQRFWKNFTKIHSALAPSRNIKENFIASSNPER
ncbi:unnamed protein product [Sphenostylis stenocarpa]|uniref:Uncharacterized protein n=1 Tax=Sphenostylis stenocarpa TaxID=92480 RepID=A0AA86SJW4_9FABA|nr:unnamed protein product [Sphenostylis stenocarpa]